MAEGKEKIKAKGVEKKKNDAGEKLTGGGENDDGIATILLKLDLHCEGCARKVRHSVRHFEGVEDVKADYSTGKLTVKGNVDPLWIRKRVEIKTKKKVELFSDQPKFDGGGEKNSGEKVEREAEENKVEDKMPKKTQFKTEVARVHCDGSAQKVKRFIMKELTPFLKDKLKRNVEAVPPKKYNGSGGGGGHNKKEKEVAGCDCDDCGDLGKKKDGESKVGSRSTEPKEHKAEVMHKREHYYGSSNPNTYYAMPPMYNQDYGVTMHNHNWTTGYAPPPPPHFTTPRDHGYGNTGYVPLPPSYLATTGYHNHGHGHDHTGYVPPPRHLATTSSHGHDHTSYYMPPPRHLAAAGQHGHGHDHIGYVPPPPSYFATAGGYDHDHGNDTGYVPPPYTAPQYFSDENPNACSVM